MEIYDLFYDECKEDGYWHAIFFVPKFKYDHLLSYLNEAREDYPFKYRLHFSNIGENEPTDSLRTQLTASYISIGCASLQQQKFERYPPKAKIGKRARLIKPIKGKFSVYRVLSSAPNENLITETLKSALKGALHFLFDGQQNFEIHRIVFEGESLQGLNDKKIIMKLSNEVRPYVKILPNNFSFKTSDHTKTDSKEDFNDSQILQLCDSMLGATRFSALNNLTKNARSITSSPIQEILSYSEKPFVRMKQSRFFRGFSLSEAKKHRDNWAFSNLKPCPDKEIIQNRLF